MSHETPKNNHVRQKLVLVETLILAIPLLVLSYILYQSGYQLGYHHLILLSMLITLILIGLIIVRQIFDKISMVAVSLKQAESGGTLTMDIRHDISEFHDISNTFNNLVKKLEETTEGLRQSQFELLTIKDISETAKEVRNIDNLFEILLEKSMSVTGAQTGSVLTIAGDTFSNKDLVLLPKQRESASNYKLFQKFRVAAARGHNETLEKDSFIDIGDYVANNVLIDGKPLLIRDIENDTRTLKTNNPKYGPPSFLSMPIFAQNKLVAVMNLSNKSSGQLFECHDEKIISIILGEISFALENATMHSNLESQLRIIKGHNLELEKEIEARTRMEKARQESEKKYKELLDLLPISVFEIDPQGNFVTVNHTSFETFGYTKDDIVQGLNVFKMFIPEDLDRVKNDIQEILNGGGMDGASYTMIRRDGSTFPVLISANPVKYMNTVVGLRGAVIDFTERRKMEDALKESEEKYRLVVENSDEAILIAQDGMLKYINPMTMKILGSSETELLSTPFIEIIHPDDREKLMAAHLKIMKGEQTQPVRQFRVCCKDGSVKWADSHAIVISWNGKPATLNFFTDVTERKCAEEALLESEKKYRFLTEKMTDIVWIQDMNLRTTYVSPSIEAVLGFTPEERLAQDVREQLTPASMSVALEVMARELALEQQGQADPERKLVIELEYCHKDGSTRWIENIISGIRDNRGVLTGLHGVSRDITKRKRAKEELRKAKEQLLQSEKFASIGRLSAGVAHEILNPVNIICMELQLLQTMENLPPDVPKELKICMAQISRIINIAENLKQMSRMPERKIVMTDINDTIAHILSLYATQLKIEGIETEIRYQSDLPVIAMDKEKMEQVILNLISNATAAMEGKEKKVLRIITEREKVPGNCDQLKITIADTGTGINSENMSKIFDPFFTTKEQGKGTGLGLYISYGIVYDHKGMIWAVNNEWGGASFYVRLPLETDIEKNHR